MGAKVRRSSGGRLFYRVPSKPRLATCPRCEAELVWVPTSKGVRVPLHWASRVRTRLGFEAEPHRRFCPAAAEQARVVQCTAEGCTERQPRLFCNAHRDLVPTSIAEWIGRVQEAARADPYAQRPRREWEEALRAAQLAVRRAEGG